MAEMVYRQLTAKEEKLLANPKLNDAQRVTIRNYWQSTEPSKTKWVFYLSYLINPLLIAGLISLLFYPESKISNLIFVYCWLVYPLTIFTVAIISVFLLALDYGRKNAANHETLPDKFTDVDKAFYATIIGQGAIKLWAKNNIIKKAYNILIVITIVGLLAYTGFIVTTFLVVFSTIADKIFTAFLKGRTQSMLDEIAKSKLTYATDESGRMIKGEIIKD